MNFRRLAFAALLVLSLSLFAYGQSTALAPGNWTAAAGSNQLPAANLNTNKVFNVTDGIRPGDCVTGGGTYKTPCISTGTGYIPWVDSRGDPMFVDANYASLSAAVTAIGSTVGELAISTASWPDGANVTVPSTLRLRFVNAGTLNQTHTVTINAKIEVTDRQIFVGNGKVIISTVTNPNFYSAWWGETTVTVAGSSTAPTLIAGTLSDGSGTFTNASTYLIAYTYKTWNGETGLSPTSSFTAKNGQALAVKPFASLSNNSKYAVGAYIYISPNGGTNWYRGDSPFYRPALVSFGDDVAGWGGVPINYSNTTSGTAPPAGGTTATTKSGITVSPPTVAPTLTNLTAVGAATYFGAYAYLCGDGTETALSPVSSGLTTVNGNYVRFQRTVEPPSGAVAVRLYLGTSSTPANLHLQATIPLHYVTADIHDYNSGGAAPSAGAAQSAVSTLQLAYDSMMESGAAGKIWDKGGAFNSPIILRLKNSIGGQVNGVQINGIGGHASIYAQASGRRYYTGTQNNNVVGVMYSTSNLEWRNLDVRDPSARLQFGLGSCDYFGGGGFESRWYLANFEAMKSGGIGYHIPVQSASSGSHTTSEQHFFESNLIGDAWGVSIHGGQTFDIRFNGCEFYSGGRSNSADSGQARIATAGISVTGWEGTGPPSIGYVFFLTGDSGHIYGNHGSLSVDRAAYDAVAGSATSFFHVSATSINSGNVSLSNSRMNSSVADRYALYAAAPINFIVTNSTGGGSGWADWINRYDAGPDRMTVTTDLGNDSYFALGSTYGFKVSNTSDIGSQLDKVVLSNINIAGYRLSNDGAQATTPAQITSNQNDYRPGGVAYVQRWSSDASRNVTGLDVWYGGSGSPITGQRHRIINVGSNNIVLKHQDSGSSASYRFLNSTGADVTLVPNGFVEVIYDGITARWRLDAATAGGGGGGGAVTSVFGRTGAVAAATNDYTLAQINPTLGSDATGDMYYRNSGGAIARIPLGSTDGQVLARISGLPGWTTGILVDPDQVFNAQTGTTYTIVSGDNTKFLTLNNASAIAVSLPQATGSFTTGWTIDVGTIGAGTATITPTTSTIDATRVGGTGAQTTLVIASGKSVRLVSNGTNWVAYNFQGRF